jgi:CDP-glucose 4,6-dehydratase
MENMVMKKLFKGIYKDKTVLITGHTGFKGSWLALWLSQMGAKVIGYSLEAPTTPNHFSLLNIDMISVIGDIGDTKALDKLFRNYKPEIVFHLAAQALVRESYNNPIETYEVNVLGTLKLFEACKKYKIKAIINVTSDKAYENTEQEKGYIEEDRLGGYDPYSSSKACSEILTASYRNSYFNLLEYGKSHTTLLASARAGNVIGGGDWAKDRLVPDLIINNITGAKSILRNPNAIRPWQHVLEPLSAYLLLGQKLLEKELKSAQAWNFAPLNEESISVKELVQSMQTHWDKIKYELELDSSQPHETTLLKLNSSKAQKELKWRSVWSSKKTFDVTTKWYKAFYEQELLLSNSDLTTYIRDAKQQGLIWAN